MTRLTAGCPYCSGQVQANGVGGRTTTCPCGATSLEDLTPRPNPSGLSGGGGGWFLAALAVVAFAALVGLALTDDPQGDSVDRTVNGIVAESCTP